MRRNTDTIEGEFQNSPSFVEGNKAFHNLFPADFSHKPYSQESVDFELK